MNIIQKRKWRKKKRFGEDKDEERMIVKKLDLKLTWIIKRRLKFLWIYRNRSGHQFANFLEFKFIIELKQKPWNNKWKYCIINELNYFRGYWALFHQVSIIGQNLLNQNFCEWFWKKMVVACVYCMAWFIILSQIIGHGVGTCWWIML